MRRRRSIAVAAVLLATAPLGGVVTAASPDAGDARQRLDGVYARPPLDRLDRPQGRSPLDGLLSRIGDLFSHLQSGLGVPGQIAVGLAAATLVALLTVWLLRRVSAGRRVIAEDEGGGDATLDADAEWAHAEAAAAGGDMREAVRRAFRSALLAVAAAGRLRVDAAWTTRELLARTAADADLLAALAPAAAAFDVAWYSGRAVSAADWETQRARCAAIRAMARRRPAAARGGGG